jgi:4-hydroxybenzoate polyprenyltransferase
LLNFVYSVRLKHVPVLDLFILASGFVLRIYAGAVAIRVSLSFWMFITTLCLSLYLACGKRRQELLLSGRNSRAVLRNYSAPLLDTYLSISEISAIVFYGLFVSTTRPALAVTMPFVLFGLFRYRYLVEVRSEGENPTEALWSDAHLMLTVLFWAGMSVYVLLPQ